MAVGMSGIIFISRVEAVAVCVNVWLDGLRHTTAY